MQMTAGLLTFAPHADPYGLWARAARLIASLLDFIGPPAEILRARDTTRRERRNIGFMLAPIEALVRSVLMSAAIVWLTTTDEGEEVLRQAARDARRPEPSPPQPSRRAAAPARAAQQDDACTEEISATAETAPEDAPEDALSDSEIALLLAQDRLRFGLHEPTCWGRPDPPPRRAAAARSSRRVRRRKPPRNLALACRYEALRRIFDDPQAAMRELACDIARRDLVMLYVPSPRNWIDERWGAGQAEVRLARRASFTRFCWYEAHRKRIRTLALPPPEPG